MSNVGRSVLVAMLFGVVSGQALATECSAEIAGTDQMQFDKKSLTVPKSCKTFTVTLTHPGKLPRSVMGHNWVLSKPSDVQGIVADGVAVGLDAEYLKPGDTRVLATTKLIGGGETDSVEFDVSKLDVGEDYAYFCSFPGHSTLMKGVLTVN